MKNKKGQLKGKNSNNNRRLLLLEFVTPERWVYNSRFYPFIKGCAENLNIDVEWICFGKKFTTIKQSNLNFIQYIELSNKEITLLKNHIKGLDPTHIIISHTVSNEVLNCLFENKNNISLLSMSQFLTNKKIEDIFSYIKKLLESNQITNILFKEKKKSQDIDIKLKNILPNAVISQTDWLLYWLGETLETSKDYNKYIVGTFIPSYDIIFGNNYVNKYQPNILILGGIICDHFGKVKKIEKYKNIDLSNCLYDFGCSFCTYYRTANSDLSIDPVSIAEEQFKRIIETAGKNGRNFSIFEICDIRLFKKIELFFEMIIKINMPPSTFCFEPRIDRILECSDLLYKILPLLKKRGHILSILRMGAESLLDKENNKLYNKNISLKQIDKAICLVKDLKEKFPNNFLYDPTLGYITCSPWTTLEDLEETIEKAIKRNFEPKGVWLYTPLNIFHGSPITQLAIHEGDIIINHVKDMSLLYQASANQISLDLFIHWKFKDERTAIAFAFIVRFCAASLKDKYSDEIFRGDNLYNEILKYKNNQNFFERPDFFAREVIKVIKKNSNIFKKNTLIKLALENYLIIISQTPTKIDNKEKINSNKKNKEREFKLQYLFEAIIKKNEVYFSNIALISVQELINEASICIDISMSSKKYRLFLSNKNNNKNFFFQTNNFSVSYSLNTPIKDNYDKKKIYKLINIYDKAITTYAPELVS